MSMCVQVTHRSGRAGARSRPGKQRERQGPTMAVAVVSPKVAFGKQHEPSPVGVLAPQKPGAGELYPTGVAAANTLFGAVQCVPSKSIFQDNFCHGLGLSQFVTKIILKNRCHGDSS